MTRRGPLSERYSLQERQAIRSAFWLGPGTLAQIEIRVQDFFGRAHTREWLEQLQFDEVVVRGPSPTGGDPVYAMCGSLDDPAPFYPSPFPKTR